MSEIKRIGVLTGGGDCSGLNAVVRAVTLTAINKYGCEVIGFKKGYAGLYANDYMELTVENVRKSSKQHKRCGTSFLFFVVLVSIIVCFFITVESPILRVVIRIALLPLIAGISYELIKLAGSSTNPVISMLSIPGLAMQNLTTKEPTDDMIEVAIKAVEEVFDWKAYLEENFGVK